MKVCTSSSRLVWIALLVEGALDTVAVAAAPASPGDAQTDAGIDLLVTSAGPATPRTCYATPKLPAFARGSYFIGGPALFEIGEYKYQGVFDGLGKMNRFEFSDGQICYTSSWLNTGMYRKAKESGRPPNGVLFENTSPPLPKCPLLHPLCSLTAPNDNNWVNMIEVGGEVLLLSDTPTMVRMDPNTLNCSGIKQWADDEKTAVGTKQPSWVSSMHAGTMGSAHPLQRPGTNTWVDVMDEMAEGPLAGKNKVAIYTFDGRVSSLQSRKKIASIDTDHLQYLHSFGVTPNYVVLPFNLQIHINLIGQPLLLGAFSDSWKGIHVVDNQGNLQVFDTEPFFHIHVVNTFENATGIVMDLGFFSIIPFTKNAQLDVVLAHNKTARDTNPLKGGVRRLHLHLSGPMQGKATIEELVAPTRITDFFKINPKHSGLPYCVYYATEWWHNDKDYGSMAILKHDVCTGAKTYWTRADHYLSEPQFIGDDGADAEDAGIVVVVALDGRRRTSVLVTLDAQTFEELAITELPGHIPFTAHGQYFPVAKPRTELTYV